MTVNLPFFLLAITLLWFPRQWLRLGSVFKRRRSASARSAAKEPWNHREHGDPRVNVGAEFSKFRNYVDLLRGAAGSLALVGGMGIVPCLSVAEGAPPNMAYAVMALRAVILFIGLLVQTVRYEKQKLICYPAIFFIAGLSCGLCDLRSAGFSFVMIVAVNPLFGGAQGFLSAYAVLIVVFGHFFSPLGELSVIYAGFLCFLPVLLSLLANRPLVIPSSKGAHPSSSP